MKKLLLALLMMVSFAGCSQAPAEENETDKTEETEKTTQEEEVVAPTGSLGSTITATNGAEYTLSYATQDSLTYAYLPDKDYIFVYVLIDINNKTSSNLEYDELNWKMEDSNGKEYTPSEFAMTGVEGLLGAGTLAPGEGVQGIIGFEVPTEGHLTLIRYDMLTGKTLASWNIIR